jgi:hypothetical protein
VCHAAHHAVRYAWHGINLGTAERDVAACSALGPAHLKSNEQKHCRCGVGTTIEHVVVKHCKLQRNNRIISGTSWCGQPAVQANPSYSSPLSGMMQQVLVHAHQQHASMKGRLWLTMKENMLANECQISAQSLQQ